MKKNILYIMCLWAALSLAACTDEADEAAWPPGGMPLELYATVQDFAGSGSGTRATSENRWKGGETVILYEKTDQGFSGAGVPYTVQADGRLTPQGEGFRAWANPYEERTFVATSPVSLVNGVTFETDQSGAGYQKSDYLYVYETTFKAPGAGKTLNFVHLASKVVVHLRAGKGMTDEELRTATVTLVNLKISAGGFNLEGGFLVDSQIGDRHTVIPNEVTPAADGYVRTVRALIIHQYMTGQKFVKIVTAAGKTFYYTLPNEDYKAVFFSYRLYEYRLTVTSEGITDSTVEGGTWLPAD